MTTPLTAPSPANPVISSIIFDQPAYSFGQKITVTINYSPGTSEVTETLTGVATDTNTNLTGNLEVTFSVMQNDTTTISVSDTGNRTWTLVSDNGSVAVFTAIA